jgi:hypothetical protein
MHTKTRNIVRIFSAFLLAVFVFTNCSYALSQVLCNMEKTHTCCCCNNMKQENKTSAEVSRMMNCPCKIAPAENVQLNSYLITTTQDNKSAPDKIIFNESLTPDPEITYSQNYTDGSPPLIICDLCIANSNLRI